MVTQDYVDTKIKVVENELRGEIRVVATKVDALTTRLDDFIRRMDAIPTDVATLKAHANHFATKAWVGWSLTAGVLVISGIITVLGKLGALLPVQ